MLFLLGDNIQAPADKNQTHFHFLALTRRAASAASSQRMLFAHSAALIKKQTTECQVARQIFVSTGATARCCVDTHFVLAEQIRD